MLSRQSKMKIRCCVSFQQIKIEEKIRAKIEYGEHFLILTLFPKNPNSLEMIRNIFFPIRQYQNVFYVNFSLIKTVQVNSDTNLFFEVFNPVIHVDITFTAENIEEQGIVFRKKVKRNQFTAIIRDLRINEIKFLSNHFISLVYFFRDCLQPEQKENKVIESVLIQAYATAKNYYDKNIALYKQNLKIKKSMKKSVIERLKQIESMLPVQEQVRNNLTCSCFDSLLGEFKVRSAVYIEESLSLFFSIINIENNVFDIHKISTSKVSDNLRAMNINDNIKKYYMNLHDVNKSANLPRFPKENIFRKLNNNNSNDNMNLSNDCFNNNKVCKKKLTMKQNEDNSTSTKTTSKKINGKDIPETPKFFSNNKNYIINKEHEQSFSMQKILKRIDLLSKNHCFVPPSNTFNIFLNTTEIIHRTFFEVAVKSMNCDLFAVDVDNSKYIKIDSMYNNFLYLRNLKNFLFNEENQKVNSFIFIDE